MGYERGKLKHPPDAEVDVEIGELRLGDLEDPKQRKQALEDLEQKVNALVRKLDEPSDQV